MTYSTPKSNNISALTSPVNAPLSSKCIFCAPIFSLLPLAAAIARSKQTNGTQAAISPSLSLATFTSCVTKSVTSLGFLFIFQLPATNVPRQCLSKRQSIPGKTLPSKNSRLAPPPVEICVILSA